MPNSYRENYGYHCDNHIEFSKYVDYIKVSEIVDERIEYIKTKCKCCINPDDPEDVHIYEDDLREEFLELLSINAGQFTAEQISCLATKILSTSGCAEGIRWYS